MSTNYVIVDSDSTEDLETQVNSMVDKGFVPVGGVAVLYQTWENERKGYQESQALYFQAMFKPASREGGGT
jgi:hypothetical protein